MTPGRLRQRPSVSFFPLFLVSWIVVGCMATRPSLSAESHPDDPRLRVLDTLQTELERSRSELRMEDYQPPYFISYLMQSVKKHEITARYGALYGSRSKVESTLLPEVRVGDYRFDNVADSQIPFDIDSPDQTYYSEFGPIDFSAEALRTSLWLLTDQHYKQAVFAFQKRRGDRVYKVPDPKQDAIASFSKEPASRFLAKPVRNDFDVQRWEKIAVKLSERIAKHADFLESGVRVDARHVTMYYVNTEGTKIIEENTYYSIIASAFARAKDGAMLDHSVSIHVRDEQQFPSFEKLVGRIDGMCEELQALAKAETLDPYTGPAILEAQAAGVLFHEVIGHRLEGERQSSQEEGRTFQGRQGQKILPEFLSVEDDPTLVSWTDKTPLNGAYRYDSEGVQAQRAELITDGILKGFLMSRTPIEGFSRSNGHGRSDGLSRPRARMANTIVRSSKAVNEKRLKAMLIEEIRERGKPYGLRIRDMSGGDTNTSTYGYQAFRGVPRLVYKVFPDGSEELVRGVEMVGTPLASIGKILATGDDDEVFNGYCGAESGYVPVSVVAPSMLIGEIELQRKSERKAKPPILPAPVSLEKAKENP